MERLITKPLKKTPSDMLLRLIYPPRCYVCRKIIPYSSKLPVCEKCNTGLTPIDGTVCGFCGKHADKGSGVCRACSKIPKSVSQNYSLFLYEGAAREIILNFKYHFGPPMRSFIKYIIETHLDLSLVPKADFIVPVPLHKKKTSERGFNQSLILAEILSELIKTPVLPRALIRVKPTARQSSLSKSSRKHNIKGAFAVSPSLKLNKELIFSKVILLVDDIYTTGVTLEECAAVLLCFGAGIVNGFTFSAVRKAPYFKE